MLIQLSDDYIPENILHRQEQLLEIKKIFNNFAEIGMGTNMAILGVTGSGKTIIIKKVIEEENNAIYINCNETKTCFKTLSAISQSTVKTTSLALSNAINKLREDPRIIVLDEIDKVVDFKKLANDLNSIYRKTMVPIIILTPKRNIVESMPQDVRKTLFFQKLLLPSYNAIQLKDIVVSRINSMDIDLNISDGSVNFISAMAAKQGSARMLMNILIRCIQERNFTQKFIGNVYEQIMKDDCLSFIHDINETEKKFLMLLLESCDYKEEVASDFLQKRMQLSAARISQLINVFERYSVVVSRHENFGRGVGRKRLVKFSNKEYYEDIDKMGRVI